MSSLIIARVSLKMTVDRVQHSFYIVGVGRSLTYYSNIWDIKRLGIVKDLRISCKFLSRTGLTMI